jgi:hypothetical protein
MTIAVQCPGCKCRLNAPATAAGKRVKCPKCPTVMLMPAPEPEADFEIVEDTFEVVEDKPAPRPKAKRPDHDYRDDVLVCPDCGEENDAEARRCDCGARLSADRPKRKKRTVKKTQSEHGGWFGFEKGILGSGVLGGMLAMIIAVVWLVVGLMNDRLFIYPPVLFVVGLVATIKGMVGGEE